MSQSLIRSGEASLDLLIEELAGKLQAGEPVDVEAYLADHPEHAERLRQLWPTLEALAKLGPSLGPDGSAVSSTAEPAPQTLSDFRILREVGRGGMGVVYEAEQVSLGRRVALKVLPFASTMDSRQLQRFKNEAHAAAQLHHTNIVPVYSVGCERGVHFYAMQFIEGQTLADVIAELRGQTEGAVTKPQPSPSPHVEATVDALAGRRIEPPSTVATVPPTKPVAGFSTERSAKDPAYFRKVVELGIQAAEALDFAHQQGIVHRDIKPANLLVDDQGRLWVTDFGLAQVQGDARMTMTGDLVGTLRYMSPEQALAKRVVVDHRTDIYSLGATLYELLTLEPAFSGTDRQELLRQIAFEEPKPLRRVNRAIPTELETIALKALEKNPAERYATAQELADDLRRFTMHEPIRARRPTLLQWTRKWARRHQAGVTAGAVCLLVTLVALVGSIGWVLGDRAGRRKEADANVQEALAEAEQRLREGNPREPALVWAARKAEAQLTTGLVSEDLRQQVTQLQKDMHMLAQLENARLEAARVQDGHFDTRRSVEAYKKAFCEYGIDLEALESANAASRVGDSAIREHLVAALDEWVSALTFGAGRSQGADEQLLRERLLAVARQADPEPWRNHLREAIRARAFEKVGQLAGSAPVEELPPATIALLGGLGECLIKSRAEKIEGKHLMVEEDQIKPIVELLRRAQQRFPADFWINHQLAVLLRRGQPPQLDEGIGFYRAAVALRPQSPGALMNLGNALADKRDLSGAIACLRESVRLMPEYAEGHDSLGAALRMKGLLDEAIAEHREALRLKKEFARAHNSLGADLADKGLLDEAITEFREAIRINKDDPEAHNNLGTSLADKGALDDAIAEHREALRLKRDFALAHSNLGADLADKGLLDEAITEFREAIRIDKDEFKAHYNLAIALRDKGLRDDAIVEFREAIRLKKDFSLAQTNLALALRSKALEEKLPSILKGEAQPADAADRIVLAALCQQPFKGLYAASTRFYGEAFVEEPQLAGDLNAHHRYNAACAAALAACGQGKDADQLDDKERARLRRQALDWLRADLAAWRKLLDNEPDKARPVVVQTMQHWQQDKDFAGVRGADALAKLPEREGKEWQLTWDEVEALRKRAIGQSEPKDRNGH